MAISTRKLTYDDLCRMPDDGNRYELIEGELYLMPSPAWWHQGLSMRLVRFFLAYLDPRGMGDGLFAAPLDVRLSEPTTVQPDLIYIAPERRAILGGTGGAPPVVNGVPDLVAEILSPSSRAHDEQVKARLYAAAGVREFWLVDPDTKSVAVYALRDGAYVPLPADAGTARSLVLPGLVVDVTALFADLP